MPVVVGVPVEVYDGVPVCVFDLDWDPVGVCEGVLVSVKVVVPVGE